MSKEFEPEMAVKQLRARMGIPYTIDEMAGGIERLLAERDEARRDRDVLAVFIRGGAPLNHDEYFSALSRCTPTPTPGTITDGMGSTWSKCGPDCTLGVTRPGEADCYGDSPATCPNRSDTNG